MEGSFKSGASEADPAMNIYMYVQVIYQEKPPRTYLLLFFVSFHPFYTLEGRMEAMV